MSVGAGQRDGPTLSEPRLLRRLSVCKVWDGEYPWDVRAEKVSAALTGAGNSVHLIARNRSGRPIYETLDEATVHRLRPWTWAPQWLNSASMFPAFFNPRWSNRILEVARETHADLILCRDLPLAVPSILIARRLGIPVVLDMAENYPAMLRSRRSTGLTSLSDHIVRSPSLARKVEEWVLPRLDGVLVVVEESRDRLISLGVAPDRIALVSNTPPLSRLDGGTARSDGPLPLQLAYIGLLEIQRGLGTVLDAMAALQAKGFPVQLSIYGSGLDERILRARAARLRLKSPLVTFHGWMASPVLLQQLYGAHVGLVPHWKDESWDTTVPNKLFDYMAVGLPIVTSDALPAARIVRETNAGLVFADRDPESLAAAIEAMADPELRRRAAECGRAAVKKAYHWERDVERMLGLLAKVISFRQLA